MWFGNPDEQTRIGGDKVTSARPNKILFCIDSLTRGGTELQLTGLIERLDRSRWEPHLLTIRPSPPELHPDDCGRLAWNVPRLLSPRGAGAALGLARRLRREDFAVVQTFFQDSTLLAGPAARLAGVPVRLASFRDLGFWVTPGQARVLRRVYGGMTGFLANAQVVRDHFAGLFDLAPERFTVTPNGIDSEALPFVEQAGPTLDIGLVGNLTRRVKRTDLFLAAAARLAQRHPDVRWHVIGDGDLRTEAEAFVARAGIAGRVVFTGRIADVAGYLERLQVGVICSDSEGLSNAVLEYQFKGCAVVATDTGGNPELVQHGETGLLVPTDDAGNLADALERLIDDVPLRRRLAAEARRRAAARYNWESCLAAHEQAWDFSRNAKG